MYGSPLPPLLVQTSVVAENHTPTKIKSDILEKVCDEIYKYKSYPSSANFCEVSEACIKKHPCLAEKGSFNGCYGWTQRLKMKMGNLCTQLKSLGCPEYLVNSLKTKASDHAFPAKKMLNDLNVVRPIISHPYLLERLQQTLKLSAWHF